MDALEHLKPVVHVAFANPDADSRSMFSRGIAELCRGVRDLGSLNASAKNMHMAYSKAWRIIKSTEDALGMQLLVRDGAHGSTLTPEGLRLLELHDAIEEKLRTEANAMFEGTER
ncbi:winged helix-turn-helix domain-containing protein [Xiamenia xianingshaonis]|uniref:LysR family transcriptional regulator n=1 Tax=Xiamenia xianingshaonis TaxID=2682776 RepID=A0A9E6MQ59_9ACTN|nr:LysR family transcriptional regulator [Xiamenia xianingshaonis]NHM14034.1 LysR family transcriptional regulator [Xiamenia xianingshaonis]QTU83907.1 LysR family transcriptional regulator [Xiamenia xianingshaonis]